MNRHSRKNRNVVITRKCAMCRKEFSARLERAHTLCMPCVYKRGTALQARMKKNPEMSLAEVEKALADAVANETKMPWERR